MRRRDALRRKYWGKSVWVKLVHGVHRRRLMARSSCLLTALALLVPLAGCAAVEGDDVDATSDAIREDTARAPLTVRVPIRFTRNEVADVGTLFSTSSIPWTDVAHERADGASWRSDADAMLPWFAADMPGAGYATA